MYYLYKYWIVCFLVFSVLNILFSTISATQLFSIVLSLPSMIIPLNNWEHSSSIISSSLTRLVFNYPYYLDMLIITAFSWDMTKLLSFVNSVSVLFFLSDFLTLSLPPLPSSPPPLPLSVFILLLHCTHRQ